MPRGAAGTNSARGRKRIGPDPPSGSIKAETLSGALELRLPPGTGATVHAESFSGDIVAASAKVQREQNGPGKSLDVRYGNGEGRIRLESFSGSVKVRLE